MCGFFFVCFVLEDLPDLVFLDFLDLSLSFLDDTPRYLFKFLFLEIGYFVKTNCEKVVQDDTTLGGNQSLKRSIPSQQFPVYLFKFN